MTSMPDDSTLLLEASYRTDAAHAAAFDTWLRDHVADLLQYPGFLAAEILDDTLPGADATQRTVHYRLRDRAAYAGLLADAPARLRCLEGAVFDGNAQVSHRLLAYREEFSHGTVTENCLNCGEVLRGQHCAHCGQRARIRVLSLWGLLRDMLGDVLDLDSRLWRTLRPLALQPGLLTLEYLRGRRTRYTPPFRMYVILSVAFFLVSSLGGGPRLIGFDDGGGTLVPGDGTGAEQRSDAATPPVLDAERRVLADTILSRVPETEREAARHGVERQIARVRPEDMARLQQAASDPCGPETLQVEAGEILQQYEPQLRDACRKIVADSQGFGRAVFANVPRMMFVFLPLVAVLMMGLYPGSGRFYVEHLLFFVHYHAFSFLFALIVTLLERANTWAHGTVAGPALSTAAGISIAVFMFYSPVYLYLAMRRVYQQGWLKTLLKFILLLAGYILGLGLMTVGLLVYTAMSM